MRRRDHTSEGADRDDRSPAEYLAVAAVLAVVLLAIGGVATATVLFDASANPKATVQAGANVTANESADTLTVTWTFNQNADFLIVSFRQGGEAMRVANAAGDATIRDDRVVLTAVGASVTFTERGPTATSATEATATQRTAEVLVTAGRDGNGDGTIDGTGTRTVIFANDVDV